VSFQTLYAHRKWGIRRNTKKTSIKNGVEKGENEGVKEERIGIRVRN